MMYAARVALLSLLSLLPSPSLRAHHRETVNECPADARVFASGPITGTLLLPRRGVPVGVAVLLHDTLGPDPRAATYADQFLAADIAVLTVQQGDDRAESLSAAIQDLARDRRIHGAPVGLVGFGRGGRLAFGVTAGIAAHAVLYPGCASLGVPATRPGHPVMLLHGDADAANPPAACESLVARLRAGGFEARQVVYARAGYAWDYPAFGMEERLLLPHPDDAGRIAVSPWPELTAMSASQLAGFMRNAFAAAQ